jgi:hypothetical protein
MRRREFLGLLGGAVMSWPRTGHAQPTTSPIVGFLNSASPDGYAAMADAFRQGLKETGYVDGRSVAIEYRWAEKSVRTPARTRGRLGEPPRHRDFREWAFRRRGQGGNQYDPDRFHARR